MTFDEFEEKKRVIDEQYHQNIMQLKREYAFSNNPYSVGDIITDHYKTIRIQVIKWYNSSPYPQCVYTGIRLNKNGKPAKDQSENKIYQSNIISHDKPHTATA